jgi:hypothetical protein
MPQIVSLQPICHICQQRFAKAWNVVRHLAQRHGKHITWNVTSIKLASVNFVL